MAHQINHQHKYSIPNIAIPDPTQLSANVNVDEGTTYIYPATPVEIQPDCRGTVVAIQYCYWVVMPPPGAEQRLDIFTLLSVSEDNDIFTITNILTVQSNPNCRAGICCDETQVDRDVDLHLISLLNYTSFRFAITTSTGQGTRLLQFSALQVQQYSVPLGSMTTFSRPKASLAGIPLLRIIIGM